MKIAIIGAGAIGAFIGAMLTRAGEDVTLIARGAHLNAMRTNGLRVRGAIGDFLVQPKVTDDLAAVSGCDVAILAVKAHSLTEIAPTLGPYLGPTTSVICAQNGIPWWYFYGHGGEFEGLELESVDPGGVVARHIGFERAIGCVIYCSTIIQEPGVVEHLEGTRFSIGEPNRTRSERCRAIADSFIKSGMRCPIRSDIREDIWVKLLGSVAYNPISALTRGTLIDIVSNPETRQLAYNIMLESETLAEKFGIKIVITKEQRLEGARNVGPHKTSMLQDLEAGRPMEVEAIVGSLVELSEKLKVPMPNTQAVYACVKLLAQNAKRA